MGGGTELAEFGPVDPNKRVNFYCNVNGFRSLQNFDIFLTPGLNVLLGINGSGKTNFIEFLDFIALLVTQNTATAISETGGIARVFGQENLRKKIPRVTAKIEGLADLAPYVTKSLQGRTKFKFEYEVDIRFSKFHTAVYIAKEKIKFKNLHGDDAPMDWDGVVGSIEVYRRSPLNNDESTWEIGPYLTKSAARNPLRHMHSHRTIVRKQSAPVEADVRPQMLAQIRDVAADESMLTSRSAFPALDAVRAALSRGRSFNLNPHKARMPDDISRVPVIQTDGSGLSATLYHMQQVKKAEDRTGWGRRRFAKDALDTVISWTQLVLPDLVDITATADPHTGKYVAYLHVSARDGSLKIPLQSTSDGTLKWLAFVCLVVSRGSDYTFEEPENFMHPRMQQYFVELLRNSSDDENDSRFIISTHSETIINQCSPEELILFDFFGGSTVCKRVDNSAKLVDQINKTGFGLGHYYTKNVVR